MLTGLSIRDIVLIDKLDLSFEEGLTVLTGETGAGKSILLDSLGLATGDRADRALVRQGQSQGAVSAEFFVAPDHEACRLLEADGLDGGDGTVILRRTIGTDGRSRAWANDQPVSRGKLAELGTLLLEVHGQHDDRSLLDISAHRNLLDQDGGHAAAIDAVSKAYQSFKQAAVALAKAEADFDAAQKDEEYILHAQEELAAHNPIAGEESDLADQRALMMQGENLMEDLQAYQQELSGRTGAESVLRGVLRRMERTEGAAGDRLVSIIQSLDRASVELAEGTEELDRLIRDLQFDPQDLEAVEERLFEIRRLARKHNCDPDQLAEVFEAIEGKAQALSAGDELVREAKEQLEQARAALKEAVEALRAKRQKSAAKLDKLVTAELPPLKLEKAIFRTAIEPLEEAEWGPAGGERVIFEVKTNPSTPFGPMLKVASGGELARFILALKVVLAESGSVPVMVFDEVDRGIGGATASAVGERLKRLSDAAQILVVTHSPQVAARGDQQFQISKSDTSGTTTTSVRQLVNSERREEIARMLAGAEITDAARAAADQLLDLKE
jgi:DNA repair protein RecN (Recombination protein N)